MAPPDVSPAELFLNVAVFSNVSESIYSPSSSLLSEAHTIAPPQFVAVLFENSTVSLKVTEPSSAYKAPPPKPDLLPSNIAFPLKVILELPSSVLAL